MQIKKLALSKNRMRGGTDPFIGRGWKKCPWFEELFTDAAHQKDAG